MGMDKYPAFQKIPRWNKEITVTEKIDGTNGLIEVTEWTGRLAATWAGRRAAAPGQFYVEADGHYYTVKAGSRNRWLMPEADNFGFSVWARANATELVKLGPGRHYGEWYGKGVQRGYGLDEKRFMLFNTGKWADPATRPACCEVATVLTVTTGAQLGAALPDVLAHLNAFGSKHVPGYDRPEGVVLWHSAANMLFKVVLDGSEGKAADGYVISPAKFPTENAPVES